MIEINLLPEELRKKIVKQKKPEVVKSSTVGLEPKHAVLLVPVIFLLLILMHLFLGVSGLTKSGYLSMLNSKLRSFEPQKKELDIFNSEYKLASEDTQAIAQLLRERIFWSEKLNKLSLSLPGGVWFNNLSVNSKEMILQCSAVSLSKEELTLIKQLIDSLKNDPVFFKDFISLDMGSAVKRTLGSYDITDFTLNAKIKTK